MKEKSELRYSGVANGFKPQDLWSSKCYCLDPIYDDVTSTCLVCGGELLLEDIPKTKKKRGKNGDKSSLS